MYHLLIRALCLAAILPLSERQTYVLGGSLDLVDDDTEQKNFVFFLQCSMIFERHRLLWVSVLS